ncbi:NADPH quinone reductase MdaB [Campylobacter mucosalis]|nr:NAD(P)H-dependent oxidoreductase [Campylobacter mucosalis]KEA45484.1 NADPH quinone reductase MdaB [Campylobacter mucosalis]QKF63349.1 flavodoxin-like fold domain-containing protein, putative NAD(P)H (quinone) dehydrogenase/reductase [Campylobacter mucosalis]
MKILLINGGKKFANAEGRLNQTLHDVAKSELTSMGYDIKETIIDSGYDIEAEVDKFLWMDVVIWQMPGWWMGEPWIVKKYVDEVFMAGYGKLFANDGRHKTDPGKDYGTGCLLDKKHMLSVTWNAPIQAFTDKKEFFEGVGVDGVYLHFRKANEFLGIKALPTYICNDVIKMPNVAKFIDDYKAHLLKIFG